MGQTNPLGVSEKCTGRFKSDPPPLLNLTFEIVKTNKCITWLNVYKQEKGKPKEIWLCEGLVLTHACIPGTASEV